MEKLKEEEKKKNDILNLETKCDKCNSKIQHKYNSKYCGGCGKKLNWEELYEKTKK